MITASHDKHTSIAARAVPRIAALASAVPDVVYDQQKAFHEILGKSYPVPAAESIFRNSGVLQRHFFCDPREWSGAGPHLIGRRMRRWADGALTLGRRAVSSVLKDVEVDSIGSMVTASCTGYAAPSPDLLLAAELGLSTQLRRTFVGHMGCFAAFSALKVGIDALAARPDEAVLVNCTEICSAHFRAEATVEQAVCYALFADASAALILTTSEHASGPEILHTHTETLYPTADQMSWVIEDDGFRMDLSPEVPITIMKNVAGFAARALSALGLAPEDVAHWCIHAGGPKIIQAVARALELRAEQYQASTDVLANYGNCSSVTSLLILQRLMSVYRPRRGEIGVMLGFGPGLTMESAVVRF